MGQLTTTDQVIPLTTSTTVDPDIESVTHRARLQVCSFSANAAEAKEVLIMLGLMPHQVTPQGNDKIAPSELTIDPLTWLPPGTFAIANKLSISDMYSHVLSGGVSMQEFPTAPLRRFRLSEPSEPLPPITEENRLFDYETSAKYLDISLTRLSKEIAMRTIIPTKFGRRSLLKKSALDRWAKQQEKENKKTLAGIA